MGFNIAMKKSLNEKGKCLNDPRMYHELVISEPYLSLFFFLISANNFKFTKISSP